MEIVEGVIKPGDSDVVFYTYLNKQYDFYLNECKISDVSPDNKISNAGKLIFSEGKATWVLNNSIPIYHVYFKYGQYIGFARILDYIGGWRTCIGSSINWKAVKKCKTV